ncbi:unnamed protein product [Heterobilharzia americana]|nr:unnamed protein product [Heterobilharzia americana]
MHMDDVFYLIKSEVVNTKEVHRVLHMQYTKWPDFGVPNSPSSILNFLWSVRASGALDNPLYPPVVHCSAGIGRSGAFVLIDLALICYDFVIARSLKPRILYFLYRLTTTECKIRT